MLKKTVTYENFNGETVTKDFYFNLTKAELLEIEVSEQEGFSEAMQKIIQSNDGKEIIAGFKKIVLMAYGVRMPDGEFYKDEMATKIFASSNAYSEIFMELATDATAGAEFVNGVIPKDLAEKVTEARAALPEDVVMLPQEPVVEDWEVSSVPEPQPVVEEPHKSDFKPLSQQQLAQLTQPELMAYFEQLKSQ